MFEFTKTIDIDSTPAAVWELKRDVERGWPLAEVTWESRRPLYRLAGTAFIVTPGSPGCTAR